MAEQLAFQQRLGQGGAVDLHERPVGAQAVVVDRAGDQLLAGAALAADQHGGVAVGDLLDEPVHLLHRVALADHVVHVEPRLELASQPDVFVAQRRPLRLDHLVQLDRLGDHRGDDVEQPQPGVEIIRPAGLLIDAQRPDGLALQLDRHAEKRDFLAPRRIAGLGPVQEARVLGDIRHDDPLARLDDPPRDALADLVSALALGPLAEPVRDLDTDRLGLRVQQRDRPPLELQVRIERAQDAHQGLFQVQRFGERFRDVAEQLHFRHQIGLHRVPFNRAATLRPQNCRLHPGSLQFCLPQRNRNSYPERMQLTKRSAPGTNPACWVTVGIVKAMPWRSLHTSRSPSPTPACARVDDATPCGGLAWVSRCPELADSWKSGRLHRLGWMFDRAVSRVRNGQDHLCRGGGGLRAREPSALDRPAVSRRRARGALRRLAPGPAIPAALLWRPSQGNLRSVL